MAKIKKVKLEDVVKVEEVEQVPAEAEVHGSIEIVLPEGEGWIPMTLEQVALAQDLGVLAGFDPANMLGLINRGEENE